jgi:hypothetical protein
MEINHNPHELFAIFKRDVKEYLLKKVRSYELNLSPKEINDFVNAITFKSTELDFMWISGVDDLLDEDTIFELDIIWMKISNP